MASINTSPNARHRLNDAFSIIQVHFTKTQLSGDLDLSTTHFMMHYSLFFSILAILSNAIATPVANNLDSSDYVTNPYPAYMGTDSGIVAKPNCGNMMMKCCLGWYNQESGTVLGPCGTCKVPQIFSIPWIKYQLMRVPHRPGEFLLVFCVLCSKHDVLLFRGGWGESLTYLDPWKTVIFGSWFEAPINNKMLTHCVVGVGV